ncbi:MAG: hypothetical protein WD757_04120 [Actinomycetota bacterium]
MEDTEHAFGTAVFILDHTVQRVSADEAVKKFSDVTQENFWRMWPQIKLWGDSLYSHVEEDRRLHATPADEDEHLDVGGSG